MRAIAAFALARLASASSVSSTLAAYQKFADEMIAKYGQTPTAVTEATDDGTNATVTDVSMAKNDAVESAAQVSTLGDGGVATSGDQQTIEQVIGWLKALYTDSLKVDHESDVDLMLKCQERIDACEDPAGDSSNPTDVSHVYTSQNSKVLYKRIGSMCQAPSAAWSTTKPTFDTTALTDALASTDETSGTVVTPGFQLPAATDPDGGANDPMFSFATPAPWTEAESLWATMHNQCNRHKQCRINHQHVECLKQKEECETYDTERVKASKQFPTCARRPDTTTTCSPEPLSSAEAPALNYHLEVADACASGVNPSQEECESIGTQFIASKGWEQGQIIVPAYFQWSVHGCSIYMAEENKADLLYTPTQNGNNAVGSATNNGNYALICTGAAEAEASTTAEPCMQVKDALSDAFIQQEWWFVESQTVENCLDEVAQWFVGCSLSTGAQQAGSGSCITESTGVWWWYQDCDLALKKCAEATLTCDDIQHEFEAAACDWTYERLQSCNEHLQCYTKEVEACAKNCRIIQHRVVGRKAEFEIIQRITCMLQALLANNEQHRTGVADSGDAGDKTSRLNDCKKMGDYMDGTQYQLTQGLDLLNITCQGPKKKSKNLQASLASAKNYAYTSSLTLGTQFDWMIDLNGGLSGDGVDEHDTNIKSFWKPGWNTADYLDWAAEYPRGSQNDVVEGCGEDSVLKEGGTGPCSTLTTPENMVTIEMEMEDTTYSGSTAERFSFSDGHLYDSKTGGNSEAALVTIKADGVTKATAPTKFMVHRKPKKYQKWGYGCSTGYRPCTNSFIRASYGFLSVQSHFRDGTESNAEASSIEAARAPCTKCDGSFNPAGSSTEDVPVDDDPCNWGTQMSHTVQATYRFDSGNLASESTTATYGQVGDQARNHAIQGDGTLKSGNSFAKCECFHSRDPNFCATDLDSTAKTCNGGSTATSALTGSYCHDDNRNTVWD